MKMPGAAQRKLLASLAIGSALTSALLVNLDACQEYDASLLHYSDAAVPDAPDAAPEDASTDVGMDARPKADVGSDQEVGDAPSDSDAEPACSTTKVDCDGDDANGCETDLTTDPGQCGACGHNCLSGDCIDGQCQPFVLADGQAKPKNVTFDSTHVYWTNQGGLGAVMRVPKGGGDVEEVAVTNFLPGGLAVDGEAVFWSDFGSMGKIRRLNKTDVGDVGAMKLLAHQQGVSCCLALHADNVYWVTPSVVRMVPKKGGNVITYVKNQGAPQGLAAEFGNLYYTTSTTGNVVNYRLLGANAGPHNLANGQDTPLGIAIDLGNVYWANNQGDADGGTPKIMMIAKENMTEPVVLADSQLGPAGVAVSGNDLFWTNNLGGTVMRMPKLGGTPVPIASNQGSPDGIAVDMETVYWVNRDGGEVMAVAR
jgi:hypothetical protein